MNAIYEETIDRERDQDLFESVTEDEIIHLWSSFKVGALSSDDAWAAIVTSISLNLAFPKKNLDTEH